MKKHTFGIVFKCKAKNIQEIEDIIFTLFEGDASLGYLNDNVYQIDFLNYVSSDITQTILDITRLIDKNIEDVCILRIYMDD